MGELARHLPDSIGHGTRPASATRAKAIYLIPLAAVAAMLLVWALLQIPAEVPDTSSPPTSNHSESINNWMSVGQTFVPERDNLSSVSVVLAAEEPSSQTELAFHVKETPNGTPLRTVKRRMDDVPMGKPEVYAPGTITERWYTFEFEPIPDSAGRHLYFSLEGKDVPRENTAKLLSFYHNNYPHGEAFLSEQPVNAHVLFRTRSSGQVADLLAILLRNLVAQKPGPLASLVPFALLVLLYGALAGVAVRTAARIES